MASFNISEDEQKKIAEKLKNFMEDEGIQGEIQLTFTKDYEPKVNPAGTPGACIKQTSLGPRIQFPCQN